METATALRSSFSTCIRPSERTDLGRCRKGSIAFATVFNKQQRFPSFSHPRSGLGNVYFQSQKKRSAIKASLSSDSGSSGSNAPIAPLELESPVGQFLSQILVSHPHLLPAAVEQQLEQLQTDRDAQKHNEQPSPQTTDLVLYKRIAEVKANERRKVLEEILYALVVQKFMDAKVPLIPSVPPSASSSKPVDTSPSQDEKLQLLHSPEALEMIQNHLSLILGNRLTDSTSIAEIDKFRVGQVYAASVMYGYFLKRVDQRFQLEKTTKVLPEGVPDNSGDARVPNVHPEVSSWSEVPNSGSFGQVKPSRLRNYVMSFDGESLQRYATIRSKEAVSIIEKHTEALFGRPAGDGAVDSFKDEVIKISFGGLRRLVLEAVTFGSFLWDVESYVDSRYHFVAN